MRPAGGTTLRTHGAPLPRWPPLTLAPNTARSRRHSRTPGLRPSAARRDSNVALNVGPYDRVIEIAVVEDEVAIADFLERGLRAEGYEVLVAADGSAGERVALDPDVDLVVLDRILPGIDGDEVLERPFSPT